MNKITRSDCFFLGALVGAVMLGFLLILSSCGVDVNHKGGVDTEVTVKLDDKIEKYFRARCVKELPGASDAILTACTNAAVGEFLTEIGS